MNILLISKYTQFPSSDNPTRLYFIGEALTKLGQCVMVVGSRSIQGKIPPFFGLKRVIFNNKMQMVLINGPLIKHGININRIISWIIFELILLLNINYFKKFKPSIIVVSSLSILTFLFGVLLKKLLNIPLVIEVRDIYPKTLVQIGGFKRNNIFVLLMEKIEYYGYINADLIISPLENLSIHIESILGYRPNFKFAPISYSPYLEDGYIHNQLSEQILLKMDEFRIKGYFIICYAGSFSNSDALHIFLDSFVLLDQERYVAILFGDGPLKEVLINKYFDRPNIIFFNSIPKKNVSIILKKASLLINFWNDIPLYKYGISPNKLIDYILSETPILTNYSHDSNFLKRFPSIHFTENDINSIAFKIEDIYNADAEGLRENCRRSRQYFLDNFSYLNLCSVLLEQFQSLIEESGKHDKKII